MDKNPSILNNASLPKEPKPTKKNFFLVTIWAIFAVFSLTACYQTYWLSHSWNNIDGLAVLTFTLYDIVPFVSMTHLVYGLMSTLIVFYYYKNIEYAPRLLSLFLWIVLSLSILREQTLLTHEYWVFFEYGESYSSASYVFLASIPSLAIALYSIQKSIPFIILPIYVPLVLWFELDLITVWRFNIVLGFFACLVMNKNLWIYAMVASLLSVDWGIDKFLMNRLLGGNFRSLIRFVLSLELFLLGLLVFSHLHKSISWKKLQSVQFSFYERLGLAILMCIIIVINHSFFA